MLDGNFAQYSIGIGVKESYGKFSSQYQDAILPLANPTTFHRSKRLRLLLLSSSSRPMYHLPAFLHPAPPRRCSSSRLSCISTSHPSHCPAALGWVTIFLCFPPLHPFSSRCPPTHSVTSSSNRPDRALIMPPMSWHCPTLRRTDPAMSSFAMESFGSILTIRPTIAGGVVSGLEPPLSWHHWRQVDTRMSESYEINMSLVSGKV